MTGKMEIYYMDDWDLLEMYAGESKADYGEILEVFNGCFEIDD
ncbi:MAG: hypothetical protein Q7S27_05020 [Nanoarchaeota archaeon]|nr:hypothetical protein [Nanoarchaeota archaeon]